MSNIIDAMIDRGMLQRDELRRVVANSRTGEPPYKVAIRTGLVSEDDFLGLVAAELGIPFIKTLPETYDPEAFSRISPLFMQEHAFVPMAVHDDKLSIVISDPFDHIVIDTLKKLFRVGDIELAISREESIRAWIQAHYLHGEHRQQDSDDEQAAEPEFLAFEDVEQLKDLASEAPVVKKVNLILTKAVESAASDIHLETFQDRIQVRFRIDGILQDFEALPRHLQQAIVSRIKIMARLDIAERRLPQDGKMFLKIAGKSIDMRVSCLPTTHGESVVIRLLDRTSISFSMEKLGFPALQLEAFDQLIRQPHGIVLVTGPTGSGKTTTLYSALNTLNSPDKKIITIEDPVEYDLDGINQVQANPKAGLTFASGLRSIVRQDPDVILIGEIRDRETADIAVQSALTGHLVFSTLHTNDAAGAVTRLVEIGVEDYLLSSSLLGILAQRLLRVLCPACKKPFLPDEALVRRLGMPWTPTPAEPLYEAVGCPKCSNTGYRGRTAIFEVLPVSDEVKSLILESKSSTAIRDLAVSQGMQLLRDSGWEKVRQGLSSATEVLRVAGG
ncbi:type II secretion system ATPase GspE [Desulfocurvibacter africanus]|uniref:type II secretion system ATPase GspE n=1 Tax=Desulfocurvibacter africanus TaxID=873 RepID=UPI0004846E01|nr:type II secretion system ATPase GspE [Desulfocurvibacter africanus]